MTPAGASRAGTARVSGGTGSSPTGASRAGTSRVDCGRALGSRAAKVTRMRMATRFPIRAWMAPHSLAMTAKIDELTAKIDEFAAGRAHYDT